MTDGGGKDVFPKQKLATKGVLASNFILVNVYSLSRFTQRVLTQYLNTRVMDMDFPVPPATVAGVAGPRNDINYIVFCCPQLRHAINYNLFFFPTQKCYKLQFVFAPNSEIV